jgi:cold-inducible RNA-binding protein
MGNKLYVGNLSYSMTEGQLREAFAAYGEVVSVSIITERDTGRSKGFGFVEMSTEEEAKAALSGMNGAEFGGRALKVDEARPQTERRPRRRRDDW